MVNLPPNLKEKICLAKALQGEWLVEWSDGENGLREVGRLTLEDDHYSFKSSPGIESSVSQLEISFGFYSQPEGSITFEYREGISPNDYISDFEDHKILIFCNAFGSEKTYFIGINKGLFTAVCSFRDSSVINLP